MSKPPEELVSGLHETVCTSRENLLCLEQLQEQVLAHTQKSSACTAAWLPPEDGADMTGLLPTVKICKVESHPGTLDIVTRLKETWAGRFYINHLKQVPLIRRLIIVLWRNLYFFYAHFVAANFSSRPANRWRPLVKLADYVESSNIPTIKVFDAVRVDTPAPKVFPAEDQAYLVSPHDHYVFPPVYVAELRDVEVYGGTNLLFAHDAVICHDLYDFERDYTSEELHGRHVISPKKKLMRLLSDDAAPEQMLLAAAFLDACAHNYAHWLTEVLPRIAAFCSIKQYANVPILVDDGLHRNIMESLLLVVGHERDVILVPIGRSVRVETLYTTSVTGYVPFERRTNKLQGYSHGKFSSLALEQLSNQIATIADRQPKHIFPEKIYVCRNSGVRKVTNSAVLEEVLADHGYVTVEPERFTFLNQVRLFRNTKKIVSPTGSALVNAIFCQPGVCVGVLMAKHEQMIYRYWANMLPPLQIMTFYILGNITDNHLSGIHADFKIDEINIDRLLASWEAK